MFGGSEESDFIKWKKYRYLGFPYYIPFIDMEIMLCGESHHIFFPLCN